jgi:hypothetical protein
MNYKILVILIVCIAAVIAAGCTGTQDNSARSSVAPVPAESGGAVPGYSTMALAGDGQVSGPLAVSTSVALADQGTDTKIIKTADVSLQVDNVTGAAAAVETIGTSAGGYVSTTNIGTDYNGQPYGTVEIRIPATQFDSALSGVQAIGKVTSLSTQGQDVTEEYVDVQAQITAYQNQIAQYNVIMKNATDVTDVLAIQQQIDTVQTNLDRVTGQMKYLNSQIDYSTITVTLQEPAPVGGTQGHDFVTAVNEGIAGFYGVIDAIIVFVISIIPLLIIGGVAYAGYRFWKGRRPAQP